MPACLWQRSSFYAHRLFGFIGLVMSGLLGLIFHPPATILQLAEHVNHLLLIRQASPYAVLQRANKHGISAEFSDSRPNSK